MIRLLRRHIFSAAPMAFAGLWQKEDDYSTLTREERIQVKKSLQSLSKLDRVAKEAAPIAAIGIIGWSLVWVILGLKYQYVKGKVPLRDYMDKTYNMAKIFGITTFLAGAECGPISFPKKDWKTNGKREGKNN